MVSIIARFPNKLIVRTVMMIAVLAENGRPNMAPSLAGRTWPAEQGRAAPEVQLEHCYINHRKKPWLPLTPMFVHTQSLKEGKRR